MGSRIDLHVHSRASGDNDADPEDMIERAIERGLDGLAFTEHYSFEASEPVERLREKYENAILIFRGVEFSAAEGHCLVFGANTDRLMIKNAPLSEVVSAVSGAGGIVIPSHPFRGANSVGDLVYRVCGFCALEGYNGANLHALNVKAVEAAGVLGLSFIGGSDAHDPREVGSCYTEFDDPVSSGSIVRLLAAGRYRGVDVRKIWRGAIPGIR